MKKIINNKIVQIIVKNILLFTIQCAVLYFIYSIIFSSTDYNSWGQENIIIFIILLMISFMEVIIKGIRSYKKLRRKELKQQIKQLING